MARQRSQEVDDAIVATTLTVIADRGVEGFSVEEVASRACVGKATIYRRYADRNELINAALGTLNDDLPAINPKKSAESVLVDMLEWVRTSKSSGAELMPRIFAQARSNPELFALCHERVIAPRLQRVEEAIALGVERGELHGDLDTEIAAAMLVSPVIMYTLLNGDGRGSGRGRKEFVTRMVDQALRGMRSDPTVAVEQPEPTKPSRRATRRLRRALNSD